jgi:hypothetical protein
LPDYTVIKIEPLIYQEHKVAYFNFIYRDKKECIIMYTDQLYLVAGKSMLIFSYKSTFVTNNGKKKIFPLLKTLYQNSFANLSLIH